MQRRARVQAAQKICWQLRGHVSTRTVPWAARRALHAPPTPATSTSLPDVTNPAILDASRPIRERLQLWQHEFGGPNDTDLSAFENYRQRDEVTNNMTKMHGSKSDEDFGSNELDDGEVDNDGDELVTIGLFLKPGDVVEISQGDREPVLAVFVQQPDMRSQFYSVNGRWCHALLSNISFAIPGCIDPVLIQPLVPFLPTKPSEASAKSSIQVPRELGSPVREALDQVKQESERIYRESATILDTAYSSLADQTRTRMMTLTQIAKMLLAPRDPAWTPSPAALLAVRKALHHDEFRFRSDARSQRLTNVFSIRPKDDVQVVEQVQEWVRQYNEHNASLAAVSTTPASLRTKGFIYVNSFVKKARRLISISRKHRDAIRGFVGPNKLREHIDSHSSLAVEWAEEFTTTDKLIIAFLQAWALTNQFTHMPGLNAACSSILQATKCYGADTVQLNGEEPWIPMDRSAGYLLLQEIGVITPHENKAIYDEQLALPTVRLSRNLEVLNNRAEATRKDPDFRDSMAALRQDWDQLEVYCIDDVGAKEIDDGISVSRVFGKPSEYWIHIHVANPTAFFDKTHVLSGLAAHMTETVYTPEQTFSMLPTWASRNYFGLDRDRPALTFSTRLDLSGNIYERKIQSGIVRRVTSITPSEVATLLGEETKADTWKLVVGGKVPLAEKRATPGCSPRQIQDLQDMYAVARALYTSRMAAGGVRIRSGNFNTRVFEKAGPSGLTWMPPSNDRARFIQSDPIIELTTTGTGGTDYLSDTFNPTNIVEEMMLLGCQTAAAWCSERNIPVMFRGTVEDPNNSLDANVFKNEVMIPYYKEHGRVPQSMAFAYAASLGRAIAHSSPIPHKLIGAKSYVKVTSPLRRFSDMIAHWQIEAALRHEARTGQKFNFHDSTADLKPVLPFSHRQIQESIVTLSPREKIITRAKNFSQRYWAIMALMRAHYYKEAPLPETFKVVIRTAAPGSLSGMPMGFMSDHSLPVVVLNVPGCEPQRGDLWEARIKHLDVFHRAIMVEPLQLLQRDDVVF
jgi:hypothetical protein